MKSSAEHGFVKAVLFMADSYDLGYHGPKNEPIVKPDSREARRLYEQAAELGSKEAKGWLLFQKLDGVR